MKKKKQGDEAAMRRRRGPRVIGPFRAQWLGVIKVPLVINDLSSGGCFVLSSSSKIPAGRITIQLFLPDLEVLTVEAEALYGRANGYAVQFVDVPDDTQRRLEKALKRLTTP
ncbi:MAG TPA: PilZ domain-containing protein [Vicinamibacterales bacterium]|nr:PilZ domain-containing protein [Vicinamibacterales bacterium]